MILAVNTQVLFASLAFFAGDIAFSSFITCSKEIFGSIGRCDYYH